jgi:tRNA pseudouridine55 synthase
MNGVLLVDKPLGWTSFDVVNYVRKIIAMSEGKKPKTVKVGHTGTLDPMATGLLVLLIGSYTKRAPELTKLDKAYEVTMRLGETSTTGDEEGEKSHVSGKKPPLTEIKQVFEQLTGEIMQTPPAYSAIKVGGRRAYDLARQGKAFKLEPRRVKVYDLRLIDYNYPTVRFAAEVSSGTYIRALVEDIGQALGAGAYMSGLRRTKVGHFELNKANQVDDELLHNVFDINPSSKQK